MPEVAHRLGVPVDRAYDLARSGELAVVRIGRYVRATKAAVQSYVDAQQTGPAPLVT